MSTPPFVPARPQTPQALLHRMPDKPDSAADAAGRKPSKHIILIMGSTSVAGKVQIASDVSKALSCPLFQGEALHDSSAKAANLGTRRVAAGEDETPSGPNEERYQRMWLSKMTRTGLLFPDESRPATEGFSGFGGRSESTSTSRRGSASSIGSTASSNAASSIASAVSSIQSAPLRSGHISSQQMNNPVFTMSEVERLRRENPALFVLTHPQLQTWHKTAIRTAVGEYGIGVIFVPLYEDDDFPVLKPLDPSTMTSFGSFASFGAAQKTPVASLDEETLVRVDFEADVVSITQEVLDSTREVMGIKA